MKKKLTGALIVLIFGLAVWAPAAQFNRLAVADIPFDFVIKDRVMPAGEYMIEQVRFGSTEALRIRGVRASASAILPASPRTEANARLSKLVFEKRGKQRYLAEVRGDEPSMARESSGGERVIISLAPKR